MTKARSNATAEAAKGDLRVGNGTNLSGILAVGSNGDTIVADSSTSTGLRYTAGTVQSNPFLNSAAQVWQRGTSFTNGNSVSTYGADRFHIYSPTSTGRTWSRQATNDTTNLPFIQYCQRLQRNSGDTQTAVIYVTTDFESVNSIPYAGKTVTFSFYARAGANFSATSNILAASLVTGTGTDQNSLSGFTGVANPITASATLTTTWQRFSYTATLNSTITQIGMQTGYTPTGTAGANDYAEVTGFQLDIGSVALPFRTYAGTIQGELAACQRYYWRIGTGNGSGGNWRFAATGVGTSTTGAAINVVHPVQMRVSASAIDFSGIGASSGNVGLNDINATFTTTNAVISGVESSPLQTMLTITGTGLTSGKVYYLGANGGTNHFGFTAEL